MTRTAFGRVAGPDPTPEPLPERLLTISELAERTGFTRVKFENDIRLGLPHIDFGSHNPGRRVKRSLRFVWPDVIAWYRGRG